MVVESSACALDERVVVARSESLEVGEGVPVFAGTVAAESLVIVDGVVEPGSNSVGLAGEFQTLSGSLATAAGPCSSSLVSAGCLPQRGDRQFCVQGEVARAPLDDSGEFNYEDNWVLASLVLNSSEIPGEPVGWDQGGGRVVGLSFKIEGPTALRLSAVPVGVPLFGAIFCRDFEVTSGEFEEVLFQDIVSGCWDPSIAQPIRGSWSHLSWDIPGRPDQNVPFEFCVSEITPLLAE